MVGEAEAPMNSKLSVGQLRNRVSSCVHLPMLFQLSPAVSDMWCGALATDDDTVTCILGIAEAVQPHVHSCAPTDAMMFGSGHFQDHRAVVLDFSTVEMTDPQVARQYRTAICDRQLLLQESVQCFSQQWWQATLCLPQGLTPNQSDALLAKWMRCGLSSVAPKTKKKPKQPWMDRATLDQVLSESAWRRQWFRLHQAMLCLKKKFWFCLANGSCSATCCGSSQHSVDAVLFGQCSGHSQL